MNWDLIGNVAFWVFVVGAALLGVGTILGRLMRGQSLVTAEATPEERDSDWSFPVLRDVQNPERYPKTWAYRAERGAEETTEIRVERP